MLESAEIDTVYGFFLKYLENPRVTLNELHKHSHFRSIRATKRLLESAFREQYLAGPRIWTNMGFEVELIEETEGDPLDTFERLKKDQSVTYLMALEGAYSFLLFKKGASILEYAYCITPSFPAKKTIRDIELTEKGILDPKVYPDGWDDVDHSVYEGMRDPAIQFWRVGEKIGKSWQTVKRRFNAVITDCDIWMAFFPRGYENYSQALITFKTKYEIGLLNELKKLDRSSFLFKVGETLILHLFYENSFEHYVFSKLRKEGKISDLKISVPVCYYSYLL